MKKDKTLTDDWFNDRTVLFIPKNQRQNLSLEAINQGEVIFKQPGSTLLAALWDYALCCKIDRLSGSGVVGPQAYGMSDVVEYLSRYLRKAGVSRISKETVGSWFNRIDVTWRTSTDEAIASLNIAYRQRFNVGYAVVFGGTA